MFTPWKTTRIRTLQHKILMWLHSGHNSGNLARSLPDTTTVAIAPDVKAPTEATAATGKRKIKAPTHQETVNSVFTAKF